MSDVDGSLHAWDGVAVVPWWCGWCLACGSHLRAYETDSLDGQTVRTLCKLYVQHMTMHFRHIINYY